MKTAKILIHHRLYSSLAQNPDLPEKNAGVVNTGITLHNLRRTSLNLCKIQYFEKTFTRNGMRDFRHPPRRMLDQRSYGILHSVECYFHTEVLGQPIGLMTACPFELQFYEYITYNPKKAQMSKSGLCFRKNGTFVGRWCHFCEIKSTIQQMCPFKSENNWLTSNGFSTNTQLCRHKSRYLLFRRIEKFLLIKVLRKAHTIARFPPRAPAHEVDFCSEVLDLSSVLTLYLTVWRKECTLITGRYS
jgi:hypothetical protein